jgi:signal transduction histidine kinase
MNLGIRQKLVLLSLLIVVVVSFSFTLLQLDLTRTWVEEDLKERAVIFAREVAATIGGDQELMAGPLLERKIEQIMAVRKSVLQIDILRFDFSHARPVIASSHPERPLPFTTRDATQVYRGRVVSRLAKDAEGRYWEVMAPITFDGVVAGGIATKFSLSRSDAREARLRTFALALTALSVLVMGLLMGLAVHWIVNRPIGRFMRAIEAVERQERAAVAVDTADEFGALARRFNAMIARAHELLFTLQRNLSHAERLALSGKIMAEVAHEVGTPLHSVMGHLELLREDLARHTPADAVDRRLDVIGTQLRRVTEIIAQLLDLTRRAPEQPAAVDLNRLVRDTSELVRPVVAGAGLSLHVNPDTSLPPLMGYGHQLQQVVLNLLTNAMDATPPGGRIDVMTRTLNGAHAVELEVRDTGRGIGEAERKQIFDPFFSTKEPGRGTGLGLFISAQIVRDHGGRIELDSVEGDGSTFRVVLPIRQEAV